MPNFTIQKEKLPNGVICVTVSGFLDAYTYQQFEKTLNDLFQNSVYRLIVDLSNLQYISSAGAGVFIGALGQVQENNGDIVLVNPTDNVKQTFDLIGISQMYTIKNTREEALKVFK